MRIREKLRELKSAQAAVLGMILGGALGYSVAAGAYQWRLDTVLQSVNTEVSVFCVEAGQQLVPRQGYVWPSGPCDRRPPFSSEWVNSILDIANRATR